MIQPIDRIGMFEIGYNTRTHQLELALNTTVGKIGVDMTHGRTTELALALIRATAYQPVERMIQDEKASPDPDPSVAVEYGDGERLDDADGFRAEPQGGRGNGARGGWRPPV
jgi:hypothetical protein